MTSKTVLAGQRQSSGFLFTFLLLAFLLMALFIRSFDPNMVPFSNDAPLGAIIAQQNRMPGIMKGFWQDLNWIGNQNPTPSPALSSLLRLVTTPIVFQKIFYPVTLLFFGLSVWFCFRQWKLARLACMLGAVAASLSSHYLSTATWGIAAQIIAFGMCFFALGLAADGIGTGYRQWLKLALAGMAVGMCVTEGYDIGAILSLFVAAFVVCLAWIGDGEPRRKILHAVVRVGVVAVFAAFVAAQAMSTLIGTQINGISGNEQTADAKEDRWSFATQWSLPPNELQQLFIAGVFGYRMDTPKDIVGFAQAFEGGTYWGAIGRPEQVDRALNQYYASGRQGPPPQGGPENYRFSGGGEYAGILVMLIALWAVAQSWRKKETPFTLKQRKLIWFWTGAAVISLLLAFGRYAPFYRLFYALPFASTIRNPTKFTHSFHLSLVILFAYGIHGICRRYLGSAMPARKDAWTHFRLWWTKASPADKRWTRFCFFGVLASCLLWLLGMSSRNGLERQLQDTGFSDPVQAAQIASFSLHCLGWFVPLVMLAVLFLLLLISGWFAGPRARLGAILLGCFLVLDLARADIPWIIYWNYPQKYASNPIIDILRQKPEEHRVAILPLERFLKLDQLPASARSLVDNYIILYKLYHVEWKQHHFQYYNIPCLDVVQMPRVPQDLETFSRAVVPAPLRNWELTSTRYLLAPTEAAAFLNPQFDPLQKRFRIVAQFDIVPKPGVTKGAYPDQMTVATNATGQLALFEFTGALPRAKLYTKWQVSTNDHDTLEQLPNPVFNPAQTVLVADQIAPPPDLSPANEPAGSLEYLSYQPRKLLFHTKTTASSILMLTDKFDPDWKVFVDGKPDKVLRCDYIMRGVQVPAGDHQVEFRFEPPLGSLYVSLAAIALGLILTASLVIVSGKRKEEVNSVAQGQTKPTAAPVHGTPRR